ncbi:13492_t:CDS:2 [Dentiscutata heterogama]|uniref:13492_t:CDS:1 n=1 Tax=Dentiscutata heterogama TaxID=1316150 RepID=A0ACA9LA42_9GLOM|nr:13492_t:CDS:2 [Dentiscutata heterogama]
MVPFHTRHSILEKDSPLANSKWRYRIEKYDDAIAQNKPISEIPKTNIREAIEFVKIAWDKVTTQTIIHAWQQTGILPNGTDVNVDNETIQSIKQLTNSELLMLINKFPLGIKKNRMELDEFINLDNYIAANEMPSMKSIIETVKEKESSEPDLSLI